ncbi:MAG: flagellar motor protein MotB [Planctomycetota bacterium]
MNRERQAEEKKGSSIPAYIVTFSDMVTLLLTFFVMLLSLANMQDPELFDVGRNSFLESMNKFGMGSLFGGFQTPLFGHVKIKYYIDRPDALYEDRTIDATDEDVRRIFQKMDKSVTTMPSQIVAGKNNFSVTNIRFSPGEAVLSESAKGSLREFCLDLQQDADSRVPKLYVLGLAGGEKSEKQQWIVSAKRARAVADFLKDAIEDRWPVYSWGAGPGGCWVEQESPVYAQSQILIAVLRSGE